jgi:hypothetical protein
VHSGSISGLGVRKAGQEQRWNESPHGDKACRRRDSGFYTRDRGLGKMAWHPAFRARIDEMIQEHKRLVMGPSYFPIELADANAQEEGR